MDFNIFNKSEQDFQETPVLTAIVDLFFSEVELVLTTEQTSILGQNDFGIDVTRMVWSNRMSANTIQDEITAALNKYCMTTQYVENFTVDVKFMQGSSRDIALITIEVKPFDEQASQKTYTFD